MYQGSMNMKRYFEGWYFKIVDADEENAFAIIPGVSFGGIGEGNHSFVQIMRGRDASSEYHSYAIDDFWSSKSQFLIRIGYNQFSQNGIRLNLDGKSQEVKGVLKFRNMKPWPVSLFSPGAMGPFRFVPKMQTLHGIISFDHEIKGTLEVDGEEIDFTGGRGYIEKDFGKEFPSAWIWMQSNNFDEAGISFTSSIANIPWLGNSFVGYLIGLFYEGEIYRFTTYTGARISQPIVTDNSVTFSVVDRNHAIDVKAVKAKSATLHSPVQGLMTGRIEESLDASIFVKFYWRKGGVWEKEYEGVGTSAGLEVMGDMEEIDAIEIADS